MTGTTVIGSTLSHYRIVDKLGQGGMGATWNPRGGELFYQSPTGVMAVKITSGVPERQTLLFTHLGAKDSTQTGMSRRTDSGSWSSSPVPRLRSTLFQAGSRSSSASSPPASSTKCTRPGAVLVVATRSASSAMPPPARIGDATSQKIVVPEPCIDPP